MSAKVDGTVRLAGYKIIEQLYSGSRTQVYRAVRECDRLPVVIKLLKRECPTFSEIVQFRNQYAIAKNLDILGIVKPYSLEPYHNGYALVMEDFGSISLQQFTKGQPLTLDQFFPIALQLTDTLHQLHQQRIIHKDIKPANILIHPDTKQVKLIDFSISSVLPKETQEIQNPNVLEGTLVYLSPEQTGRMNRGIDYRSDFYSLGVSYYELLTGQLPFDSKDPLELVHWHIAKQPTPLEQFNIRLGNFATQRNPDTPVHTTGQISTSNQSNFGQNSEFKIPKSISDIVMKLMAKNAEDRYQSALGLKHDLHLCWEQLKATGKIENFQIAQQDVCDRFLIPDKLYGREIEIETLIQAFARVSLGATEMMLVAGFSGIGKTAVINEVHKPIVQLRGYFIKGKYDQFQRNIPFSAFVQAYRDLIGQLLTESDAQIQQWRNQILEAVGENGQVIIEVIPELERIIGQQPPATELSGSAAQNRFNLLFQKFTKVFTSASHPLVIFLDDLQWADLASLKLIQLLMAETKHLFLIGAYRDNEVTPAHPLMLTLIEMQKTQVTINTITLAPLSQTHVNQLVADTLKCAENFAWSLSQLISQKTQGNPFFATQFLKALYQEQLIQFNFESGCWQCDIAQVNQQALTDDVVAFIAFQLRRIPPSTQNVLQLAACIGNQFDLTTLAIVSQQSEVETATDLWKALQEGLILPISDIYKFYQGDDNEQLALEKDNTSKQLAKYRFLHDRIQQAAYSLIPDDQKQVTHLQIGRLLQQATPISQQDQNIFAIVNHFNKGASLIHNEQEQQELVQLNLAAGQKAKSATAYGAALDYFNTGISLLASDRWQRQYNLALALYEGAANSAYLSTHFEQIEQFAQPVLNHAHSWLDQINIYETKILACVAQEQRLEAIRLGREVLASLGVSLPEQPTQADIGQAIQHTQTLLDGRSIQSLLELPQMTEQIQKLQWCFYVVLCLLPIKPRQTCCF